MSPIVELLKSVDQLVVIFLPILSIAMGIAIAIAFVERIGVTLLNVFKDAPIKEEVAVKDVEGHLAEKAKRRLEIDEPEKPKRDFIEHDDDLLEVVDCDKPKRGNSYDG
jgi:hypothetical protein